MGSRIGENQLATAPKTNSKRTENRPFAPKGNNRIPTIHFQVRLLLVSGRVNQSKSLCIPSLPNTCSGVLGRVLGFKYLLTRCVFFRQQVMLPSSVFHAWKRRSRKRRPSSLGKRGLNGGRWSECLESSPKYPRPGCFLAHLRLALFILFPNSSFELIVGFYMWIMWAPLKV